MSHGYSTAAIAEAICTIMMAKNVNHFHGHLNFKKICNLEEQLTKARAVVHTTTWRGKNGYLPLALKDSALARATNDVLTSTFPLLDKTNKEINDITSAFK